jgi:hypothetical protein
MNSIPKKPGSGGGDDPNIPVLTDRLGFPPLEFDTTLPMIDSTLGKFEDSSLNIPTVQPIDAPADEPLKALYDPAPAPNPAPAQAAPTPLPPILQPVAAPVPPAPSLIRPPAPAAAAGAPRSAAPPSDTASGALASSPRVYGGALTPLELPPMPAPPPAAAAAPAARPAAPVASAVAAADTALNWARIESEACNAVVRKIAERLPGEIETVIRAQMAPTIERLLSGLATETRLAIAASVREIVTQAVHTEIERMRRSTRGPS